MTVLSPASYSANRGNRNTFLSVSPQFSFREGKNCKLPLIPVIFDGTFSRFDYEKYNYIESFNFFYGGVDDSMIKTMHSHGKEVKIWTLESPDDAVHLAVDAVITNRPDLWQ